MSISLLPIAITIIVGLLLFIAAAFYYLKKRQAEDAVEQSSLCLQKSLGIVSDAVTIVSASGMIQYVNKNAEDLLHCEQRSVLGKNFWSLYSLLDHRTKQPVDYLLDGLTKTFEQDFFLVLQDKQKILTHITIHPIDFSASISMKQSYALVIKDRSEQDSLALRFNYLENYDQVTALPNRRYIEIQLHHALADSRKHGAQHVFCYISLDKTKNISDMAGHSAVETLIVQIAKHLKTFKTTKHDVLARVSSEEFAILYRETEPSAVVKHISRLRQSISEFEFKWQDTQHPVSASIGFLLIHAKSASATAILSDADIASRIARAQGGNRVALFKPNDPAVLARKGNLVWVRRIKQALEQNRFCLFSQPIHPIAFNTNDMPFFHYETLIRLFDEKGDPIPPDNFLPAAEEQGMMLDIDKWVVHEAFRNLKLIKQISPLPVFSINLSGQSVNEAAFLDFILHEIKTMEVNPQMICFELTESVAVNSLETAMQFMQTLKDLGCRFSLDDFGTGVSSYAYLRQLPINYLKIDGIFIKDIVTDEISQEMVRSIKQIGHVMGLEIIAEYVENNEIVEVLNEIGIDYGQGYGISRPMPIDEVVATHQQIEVVVSA